MNGANRNTSNTLLGLIVTVLHSNVFFNHQQIEISLHFQVSLIITVAVYGTFACSIYTGYVTEIKSFFVQSVASYFRFTGNIKLLKYPPVSSQTVVHITHIVIAIAVQFVIVSDPALITTEFFIYPAGD